MQQYDNYEKKIKRVASVLSRIVRLLPLIVPVLCVIIIGMSALLVAKGNVGIPSMPEQLTYGDSLSPDANAFLSSVRYEYRAVGSAEWTQNAPVITGSYEVRAAANGAFGRTKYSDAVSFTILPRSVDVMVVGSVVYGETPALACALAYGDKLICESFEYDDILADQTAVTPVVSSLKAVDENGNDVSSAYVFNAVTTTVSIQPRPITVTVEDTSKVYDGKALSFDGYELTSGRLAANDELVAVIDSSLLDVGVIKNAKAEIRVVTKDGRDATHKYKVTQQIGSLSVEKRAVIIKTGDYEGTYDGTGHVCFDYTVDESTPLARQHYVSIKGYSSVTDAGSYDNRLSFVIYDYAGVDKTENHSIFYEYGKMTIAKKHVVITTASDSWVYDGEVHQGSIESFTALAYQHELTYIKPTIVNVGTMSNALTVRIKNTVYGTDTTENYDIEYVYGTLEVTKRSVTVKTDDYSGQYDGTEQSHWRYTIISELDFAYTDSLDIISGTVGTDVVDTVNEIYTYRVINRYLGTDVTDNYDITLENSGRFHISQRSIAIKPKNVHVTYDGKQHSVTEIDIVSSLGLVSGHTISAQITGTLRDAGEIDTHIVENTVLIKDAGGRDVTHNYASDIYSGGYLCVESRVVYVITMSDIKMYDGTPLTRHEFTVFVPEENTGLLNGHEISLRGAFTGEQTGAGVSDNTIDPDKALITAQSGEDMSRNYRVEVAVAGKLEVIKRPIIIESYSAEKKYDGAPLTAGGGLSADSPDQLVDGHVLDLVITGIQLGIGKSTNSIDCENTAIMYGGEDLKENYDISYVEGTLEVTPWAVITITTKSAQKRYDGTPLTNGEYTVEYSSGALDPSHTLSVIVTGSRTEVGRTRNNMIIYVTNGDNEDVSAYYTIVEIYGTLEVYDPKDTTVTVATVKTDKGGIVYLRQNSYGKYTGSTNWGSAPAYGTLLPGGYNCNYLTSFALKNSGAATHKADIELLLEDYMLPYYLGMSGEYEIPTFNTNYKGAEAKRYSVEYYPITDDALANVYSLRGNLGEYESYELAYREFVYANYMDIPYSTREYMESVIAEQGFSLNDGGVIYKIASFIRSSAEYDLGYDTALDFSGDVAVEFLKTYKSGVCRHYATSATMLYRALGIPARYVTGYTVDTSAGKTTDVTTPGHAWVEVYIDGVGWIQVEVTGGSGFGGVTSNSSDALRIIPAYQSKIYDGEALVAKNAIEHSLPLDKLLREGYTYEVTVKGMCTHVGIGTSSVTEFVLYDKDGKDVTAEFDIEYVEGVLEVLPSERKAITVLLYQLQQVYNAEALSFREGDWEVLDLEDGLTLIMDIDISLTNVGILTLGRINAERDRYVTYTVLDSEGRDVTSGYMIVFDASYPDGTLYVPITVDKRAVELTAASESKLYDGAELSNPSFALSMGTLAQGHTVTAISRGGITDVGTTVNEIDPVSVSIIDKDGNDVTHNYVITTVGGVLEIIEPEEEY